jgi:hypothetical protein
MADVTLAGVAVVSGDLILPLVGNCSAHLHADAPVSEGRAVLRWLGTDLQGTILRAGESEGRTTALWVGGAGGLSEDIPAQPYGATSLRLPLADALAAAGESLSTTSTASALAYQLDSWPRLARAAGAELDALADAAGAVWRVLPDGSVFFGVDTFAAQAGTDYTLIAEDHGGAWSLIGPDTLAVLPGQTMNGRRAGSVVYTISAEASRARVWWLAEGATEDPVRAGLAGFVDERISLAGLDYLALYPARVVVQRDNGTVDVQPDSDKIPPMTERPYRGPCHGAKLTLPAGSRVTIAFLSKSLRSAVVLPAFEPSGAGHKAAGRVGDPCKITAGSLATWMGQVEAAITALMGVVPTPSASTFLTSPGIEIAAGSPHLLLLPGSTP